MIHRIGGMMVPDLGHALTKSQVHAVLRCLGQLGAPEGPPLGVVAEALAVALDCDHVQDVVVWQVLRRYAMRSVLGSQISGFGVGRSVSSAPENWYATVGCLLQRAPLDARRVVDRREVAVRAEERRAAVLRGFVDANGSFLASPSVQEWVNQVVRQSDPTVIEQVLARELAIDQIEREELPPLDRMVSDRSPLTRGGMLWHAAELRIAEIHSQVQRLLHGMCEPSATMESAAPAPPHGVPGTGGSHGGRVITDSMRVLRGSHEYSAGMRYLARAMWHAARADRSFLRYAFLED